MLARVIIEWFCFVFVAITFPIYIFYVVILIKYRNTRELKGTFFQLCISIGICDIVSMMNNYIGYRFPSWGWGKSLYLNAGPPLAEIFICLAWFLRVYQGIGVVLLAVNRATAIIWSHKYLKIWTPLTLRGAIGLQLLYGLAFITPLFFQKFHWEVDNTTLGAVAKFDDNVFKAKYFSAAFFQQAPVVLLIVICYGATFVDLHRRNAKVTTQGPEIANRFHKNALSAARHVQEMKLALMGAFVCAFEIVWFLFILYTSVIQPLSTETFFLIYNFLNDIYSGVNPYLLFIFCSGIRERIKIILRLKTEKTFVSVQSARHSNVSQISRLHRISSTHQQ